jgi:hypothetical protein
MVLIEQPEVQPGTAAAPHEGIHVHEHAPAAPQAAVHADTVEIAVRVAQLVAAVRHAEARTQAAQQQAVQAVEAVDQARKLAEQSDVDTRALLLEVTRYDGELGQAARLTAGASQRYTQLLDALRPVEAEVAECQRLIDASKERADKLDEAQQKAQKDAGAANSLLGRARGQVTKHEGIVAKAAAVVSDAAARVQAAETNAQQQQTKESEEALAAARSALEAARKDEAKYRERLAEAVKQVETAEKAAEQAKHAVEQCRREQQQITIDARPGQLAKKQADEKLAAITDAVAAAKAEKEAREKEQAEIEADREKALARQRAAEAEHERFWDQVKGLDDTMRRTAQQYLQAMGEESEKRIELQRALARVATAVRHDQAVGHWSGNVASVEPAGCAPVGTMSLSTFRYGCTGDSGPRQDEHESLSGVQLTLQGGGTCTTLDVDDGGEAFASLTAGTYRVTGVQAPRGYVAKYLEVDGVAIADAQAQKLTSYDLEIDPRATRDVAIGFAPMPTRVALSAHRVVHRHGEHGEATIQPLRNLGVDFIQMHHGRESVVSCGATCDDGTLTHELSCPGQLTAIKPPTTIHVAGEAYELESRLTNWFLPDPGGYCQAPDYRYVAARANLAVTSCIVENGHHGNGHPARRMLTRGVRYEVVEVDRTLGASAPGRRVAIGTTQGALPSLTDRLPPGPYVVRLLDGWHDGLEIQQPGSVIGVNLCPGQTAEIDFCFTPCVGSITVTATRGGTCERLEGVRFRAVNRAGEVVADATTGEHGIAVLGELDLGDEYWLSADPFGLPDGTILRQASPLKAIVGSSEPISLTAALAEDTGVDGIVRVKRQRITGSVMDPDGRPLHHGAVQIIDSTQQRLLAQVPVRGGRYSFETEEFVPREALHVVSVQT